MFSRKDLPLDFVAGSLLLNRFFNHLSGTKRKDRSGLAKALKQSGKDVRWNDRLFAAILRQDEHVLATMSEGVGLDPLTLLFLGKTNRDPEDLGYFEAEGEEGLRVYFCNSCHRYLKTIDSRVFEEVAPLELESLATLHLDLIAEENGYK